jgi:nucleoside-diphosphate-sugar epimerase
MVDFTYVENVVHGHILAAENLGPGKVACGKVSIELSLYEQQKSENILLESH